MTLKKVIADSFSQVFLRSTDEFAEDVEYRPKGVDHGFTIRIVAGSPTPTIISSDEGNVLDRRTLQVFAQLSVLIDGIVGTSATVRKPRRGDLVIFEVTSDFAGEWSVVSAMPDGHGGIDIDLKFERIHAAGAAGAQKVD